jgi:hypothetical protein
MKIGLLAPVRWLVHNRVIREGRARGQGGTAYPVERILYTPRTTESLVPEVVRDSTCRGQAGHQLPVSYRLLPTSLLAANLGLIDCNGIFRKCQVGG